jgi:hypothetical protein
MFLYPMCNWHPDPTDVVEADVLAGSVFFTTKWRLRSLCVKIFIIAGVAHTATHFQLSLTA